MFEKIKNDREINKITADMIDREIREASSDFGASAKDVYELWEKKMTVRRNGVSNDTIAKIAATVVITVAIMAFETRFVMSKTATKFIKPII